MPPTVKGDLSPPRHEVVVRPKSQLQAMRSYRSPFPGIEPRWTSGLSEADDRQVWNHANAEGFAIVSHDVDFAEMAAPLGSPPKVIWLRTGNQSTAATSTLLRRHAELIVAFGNDD